MPANLFDKLSPKAAFLASLFSNAGFNVDDLVAKNDANALKAHIETLKKEASREELTAAIGDATAELNTQVTQLEQKLTTATAHAEKFTTLVTSIEAAGVKLGNDTDPTKVKAAVDLHAATVARNMVAKAGHPGLLDDPALDPTKQKAVVPANGAKATTEGLTGRDRMAAAFNKQHAEMYPRRNGRN